MRIRDFFGEDIADAVDQRLASDCPNPARWWREKLGLQGWTEKDRKHIETCTRCQETERRLHDAAAQASASMVSVSQTAPIELPRPVGHVRQQTSAGPIESTVSGSVGRQTRRNVLKSIGAAASLAICGVGLGAAWERREWQLQERETKRLHLENYIEWAFHTKEHPSIDPEKALFLQVTGDTLWIAGSAWQHVLEKIEYSIEPGWDEKESVSGIISISDNPDAIVPFAFCEDIFGESKISRSILRDGKIRDVTVRLVPHEVAKQAYAPLRDDARLVYRAKLVCSPRGLQVIHGDAIPLAVSWNGDGQLKVEWLGIETANNDVWIWMGDPARASNSRA